MIGNGHDFKSGRKFSAWIGLVPGQYSSGGKTRLGRITMSGDAYLRWLLVMGARVVLNAKEVKSDGDQTAIAHNRSLPTFDSYSYQRWLNGRSELVRRKTSLDGQNH